MSVEDLLSSTAASQTMEWWDPDEYRTATSKLISTHFRSVSGLGRPKIDLEKPQRSPKVQLKYTI